MKNKRGLLTQAIILLIMFIVMLSIILFYYVWSMTAPFIVDIGNDLTNEIKIGVNNETPTNLSNAATVAFDAGNETLQLTKIFTYFFFIVMVIGFIVIASFVRTYPFLIFIWLGCIVFLVFVSLILTSQYQEVYADDAYAREVYSDWQGNNFLMNNLPIIVLVMGVVGGIVMFIQINRDSDIEAGGGGLQI